MIVRCIKIIRPGTSTVVSEHPGVRIGEEYPVLEVFAARSRTEFRLPDRSARRDEIDSPGLWDADMFEIVSDRMPTCWVTGLEDGLLTLAPREWQRPGFWEDYFDHEPGAVAEYDRLKARIIAEA
ncbi:hypothetical protein OOK58_42480 [Streptomyces sp. NBC_01728]|uniref:hypothetical protein n=1 Tax=unclassified Streptomyces TaxID=2593676 RepID=UPI00224E1096|nr:MULTISPECIES: hypothetical protein [unclassified Streptomyces]MCX4458580.1 hypothetical protein [Streptomyces sp. NBC_01719]MCX4497937.1 hypothetical protein [Streptomyces sp. NBC_01728]